MKKSLSVFATILLASCASNVSSLSKDSAGSYVGAPYKLAQAYYEVRLEASQYRLDLHVDGPYLEARDDLHFALGLNKSRYSAASVAFDVDPRGIPQAITFSSDNRAQEIASALGTAIGTLIGVSGDVPSDAGLIQPGDVDTQSGKAGTVPAKQPRTLTLFQGRWRPTMERDPTGAECNKPEVHCFWEEVNAIAKGWADIYATDLDIGEDLISVSGSTAPLDALTHHDAAVMNCSNYVCFSQYRWVETTLSVSGARVKDDKDADPLAAPVGAPQQISFGEFIPDSNAIGYLDLSAGGFADTTHQVLFANGAPTFVGLATDSPVETVLNAPVAFIAGVLNAFVSVVPLRLYIDIQRREASEIIRGGDGPPTSVPEGTRLTAPSVSDPSFRSADAPETTNKAETLTASKRVFVLIDQKLPVQPEDPKEDDPDTPKTQQDGAAGDLDKAKKTPKPTGS